MEENLPKTPNGEKLPCDESFPVESNPQNTPNTQNTSSTTPHAPKPNKIGQIKLHELTLEAVFDAYYDCRRRKRNTMQSMNFEFDQEKNLF